MLEEQRRLGGEGLLEHDLARLVADADRHGPGVQIDATVESVRFSVEVHAWSSLGMGPAPEPASWLEGYGTS